MYFVVVCASMHHTAYVKARGELEEVGSLFPHYEPRN